jgi:HD-GYP domain-containing protein (c-di-GMP phosphodiesterase class II)
MSRPPNPPRVPRAAARRPWLITWVGVWIALVGIEVAAAVLPGEHALWTSAFGLFAIVVVAASLCAVASAAVLVVAHRQGQAELGMIGTFGYSVSVLPLVHGITTPGVLYGPNTATMVSVFLALPLASAALLPLIAPRARWSRTVTRDWRFHVALHVFATTALALLLLVLPSGLPGPKMGVPSSIAVAVASLMVCFVLSARHLRLSWIGRSSQSFAVSVAFAMIGASSLVWVGRAPFTAGFWLAHALDIVGVFLLTLGGIVAYRQQSTLHHVLRPLVANEPLSAFALGLEPLVHRFVASLEAKDPITRDHVARTAVMAMQVGEQLHLPAAELHDVGLGALLHDVGKLMVDDAILRKPGRLDASEYEAIKLHTTTGEAMVCESVVLAAIGATVRGHHERVDGGGYPDGLVGEAIPLAARIVSVCDAFDAMANTRQYRVGMGIDKAIAILREHAGSQWDPRCVEALVQVVRRGVVSAAVFDEVGRTDAVDAIAFCGCEDALPVGVLVGV